MKKHLIAAAFVVAAFSTSLYSQQRSRITTGRGPTTRSAAYTSLTVTNTNATRGARNTTPDKATAQTTTTRSTRSDAYTEANEEDGREDGRWYNTGFDNRVAPTVEAYQAPRTLTGRPTISIEAIKFEYTDLHKCRDDIIKRTKSPSAIVLDGWVKEMVGTGSDAFRTGSELTEEQKERSKFNQATLDKFREKRGEIKSPFIGASPRSGSLTITECDEHIRQIASVYYTAMALLHEKDKLSGQAAGVVKEIDRGYDSHIRDCNDFASRHDVKGDGKGYNFEFREPQRTTQLKTIIKNELEIEQWKVQEAEARRKASEAQALEQATPAAPAGMQCPACGAENIHSAKFCTECGDKITTEIL